MTVRLYTLNEGTLELPVQWQDQSMNAFIIPDENNTNLVINRIPVPFGISDEEYYLQVIEQFRHGLKEYKEYQCQERVFNNVPSHLLEYQWQSPQGKTYQMTLLYIQQGILMTFIFSSKKHLPKTKKKVYLTYLVHLKLKSKFQIH